MIYDHAACPKLKSILISRSPKAKQTAQVHRQIDPPHPHLRDTETISSVSTNTILGAIALHGA